MIAANEQIFFLGTKLRQQLTTVGKLEAEQIISKELGYMGKLPRANLSWDIKIFHDKMDSLIDTIVVPFDTGTPFDDNAELFENSLAATIQGAELQLLNRKST